MAIGDIYNAPPVRKNRNLTIAFGGTVQDWNVETELDFNRNEWELDHLSVIVTAQQSYIPFPFTRVRLDMTYAMRNYISNGSVVDSGIGQNSIEWMIDNANLSRNVGFEAAIQGSAPARTSVYVTVNYKLPVVAVSPQNCNTTVDVGMAFKSKVANPVSRPFVKTPKEGGGATNWDLGFVLVVGVLGIVGLVALGWAAEKTGVNVGVLGGIYSEGKKLIGGAGRALHLA